MYLFQKGTGNRGLLDIREPSTQRMPVKVETRGLGTETTRGGWGYSPPESRGSESWAVLSKVEETQFQTRAVWRRGLQPESSGPDPAPRDGSCWRIPASVA